MRMHKTDLIEIDISLAFDVASPQGGGAMRPADWKPVISRFVCRAERGVGRHSLRLQPRSAPQASGPRRLLGALTFAEIA